MEKVIKSIFCCSGEDSNSSDSTAINNKPLNSNRGQQRKISPQQSKNQSIKNNNSRYMGDHNNNQRTINKKNQQHQNRNLHNNNNNNNNQSTDKTDVNVYEATDSTLETNDDGTGAGQHQRTSVLVDDHTDNKSSKFGAESSADSGHESDIEMNENDSIDDFFDLTKIQPGQAHASNGFLLENIEPKFKGKKCLVLDLDETLVHSFKYLRQADFVIPVDIDNQLHNVYVIKRPGVDEFMKRVGELYEVVVFTASVSRYGDPLLDELDVNKAVHHRLFRDSCYNYQGNYIKNLSQIGRPLNEIIILDNSPASYIFHPQHAIPISSWFSDAHDNELLDIIPFLEDLAKDNVDDVGLVLDINL